MPSYPRFKFIDESPAHTQIVKDRIKAEASAHAARISHQRRRRVGDSQSRPLTLSRWSQAAVQRTRKSISLSTVDIDQHQLPPIDSRSTNISSTHSTCEVCGYWTISAHEVGASRGHSQMDHGCEYCGNFERSAAIHKRPASWPDWVQEDIVDLQFFMDVLGSSVQHLSDSGFFNIVVPCLVQSDVGIRDLVLAIASAHRNILSSAEVDCHVTDTRALEKCNKGIGHLSGHLTLAPCEISMTSWILLATWYMFRLDPKAASLCTHAAETICHMNRETRLKHRLLSARNVTDPQSTSNYRKSTFASIIAGTVAKLGIEFPDDLQYVPGTPNVVSVRLDLSSKGLRFRIKDMHDLLSSIEMFAPVFQQLRMNLSYHAHLDHQTSLAQDLLVRIDQVAAKLQQAPTWSGHIMPAIEILWQWHRYYSVGIQCQILSSSELSWDKYLGEFRLLAEWSERLLSRLQNESSYVFLPVVIILRPLWFTAVHCRDPNIRSYAIAVLLRYHRNEAGLDSWFAGHVAQELMNLEMGCRSIHHVSEIRECDRVLLRGFESRGEELYLLYVYATEVGISDIAMRRQPFVVPRDPHGVVQMCEQNGDKVNYLHMLAEYVGQTDPQAAPLGSLIPIYHDDEAVEIVLPVS